MHAQTSYDDMNIRKKGGKKAKNTSYHVLLYVIILCHLYEGLKQPPMMLDQNLTCFPIATLKGSKSKMKMYVWTVSGE